MPRERWIISGFKPNYALDVVVPTAMMQDFAINALAYLTKLPTT